MWARLVELAFGVWLVASPFILGHRSSGTEVWLTDVTSGALLVTITALNYRDRSRPYHLLVLLLGAWLVGSAVVSGPHPLDLLRQNHIIVGLVIMMSGIVPNQAFTPPEAWRVMGRRDTDASPDDTAMTASGDTTGSGCRAGSLAKTPDRAQKACAKVN